MATKDDLEKQVVVHKKNIEELEGSNKELQAMISLWLVKLESTQRSSDHPTFIINDVIESMKNYLGI